jgi:phytoene dehydrogenase-like protein
MSHKIKIIGAGISGLAAGSYLQMNGYDTEIIEQHSIPGGLCTGWKRNGYTFDGCIHWLLGSAEGSAFNRLWAELFDLKAMKFVNHEIRVSIEVKNTADRHGNKVFHFHSNVDTLEKYMLDIAPEDRAQILKFTHSIRCISKFDLPPLVEKAPKLRTFREKLQMLKLLPLILFLSKWGKISNLAFSRSLKNPFLKEVFSLLFEGRELSILAMTMQLAYFNTKCAGYPVGGSLPFAKRLEERYRSLGGRIKYNTPAGKIITSNGRATGIQLGDNTTLDADIIVSAADWHSTIFTFLDGKFTDPAISSLRDQKILDVFDSAVLVSLGISRTFNGVPHLLRFPLGKELDLGDGTEHKRIETHFFNYDPTMAPAGKTVVSVTLTTKNGDFWIDLREKDLARYKKIKAAIASSVIDILDQKFGEIKNHVENIDVATPATFSRYTGNWKGSIQGWMPTKKLFSPSPVKNTLPGLKNFYMIGHWMEPGGGLPIALLTARNIAQEICHHDKIAFKATKA